MRISVSRLWHHPVKSMQGRAVPEVVLGPGGVVGDRAYGFVDLETERLVSAKHPKCYGAMLTCGATFAHPPQTDAPIPPVRVTFPDGTTVDGDEEEITRRVSALLGREVRMVTSVPEGVAYEEVWPERASAPTRSPTRWRSRRPTKPASGSSAFPPGSARRARCWTSRPCTS